jgi:hypothetical protein
MLVMSDKIPVIARKALDHLDRRGWCQSTYESPDGKICLESAILAAMDEEDLLTGGVFEDYHFTHYNVECQWELTDEWMEIENRIIATVHDLFPGRYGPIGVPYDFNDSLKTSEEDVRLVLKTIAAELCLRADACPGLSAACASAAETPCPWQ